jgi:hypothetical protein
MSIVVSLSMICIAIFLLINLDLQLIDKSIKKGNNNG